MKKMRKVAKLVFFPKMLFAIIFSVAAALLVLWRVLDEANVGKNLYITYTSYFLCAYSVVLFVIRLIGVIRTTGAIKKGNKYVRQFFSDTITRVKFTLYYSILLNLVFAALQIYIGVKNQSGWFAVLGIYYFFLVLVRVVLLFEVKKNRLEKDFYSEHKACRFCGTLVGLMDISVTGVMYYIIKRGEGFSYNFFITAAFGVYAFCILTFTIFNLVRCSNVKTPIVSTAEWINLVEALMCVMFLETSLISLFGKNEDFEFRTAITAASGVAILLVVLFVSIWIYAKNTVKMKKLRK